ncbi:MAG: TetR/AcrR family transcriptional regulator [Microthrixaceae bacterium]|nr:TetR/AcrR family transcriptional regulator [Microthrixaceae bacterium]
MAATAVRDRVIDAVLVCVERVGLGALTLDEVAAEAGLGRATIYRHFEGGREQLIREAVLRELTSFWTALAEDVAHLGDIESRLVAGLVSADRRLDELHLLRKLVSAEPEELLPTLFESESILNVQLRSYVVELLAREQLREGVDPEAAADYLGRMLVMHIASHGRWDLSDEEQVRRLVRTQFLAGILDDGL